MLFRIVLESGGGSSRKYMGGLTFEKAYQICEDSGWEQVIETGFIWDMVIEEDD